MGLDALEAAALSTTGILVTHDDPRHALPATAAATLPVTDAWFDTTAAASGADLTAALTMAVRAELPLAGLCAYLAARSLTRGEWGCSGATE